MNNTEGFPFMIQLVGYQTWRQNPEKKNITLEDTEEGGPADIADMADMEIGGKRIDLAYLFK